MQIAALIALAICLISGERAAFAGIVQIEPGPSASARLAELQAALENLRELPPIAATSSTDQKRLALVIGNENYAQLDKLNKAVGDAHTISDTLNDLGFTVTTLTDVDVIAFDDALDAFYKSVNAGDIAFFFFSGHGVATEGINYLLPVDMPAINASEIKRIERSAVNAQRIVAELTSRGAELTFVVLDACRDDPFPKADTRGATRVGGLARMDPDPGAFVIYSAGAGQTALDRLSPQDEDPNSIFTRKFWSILKTPGMPIVEIAKRTQVEVKALADKARHPQAPAYYDQVIGQFYLREPQPKLYGLVIGIDEYNGKRQLAGAVNDGRMVADALRNAGASEVIEAFDGDARLPIIADAWRSLIIKAEPGDTVVFSYAGASFRRPAPGDTSEADGRNEYLALAEADWEDLQKDQSVQNNGASLSDDIITLWMELAASKNLNVIFVVDGCHGGGLLDREFANISFIGASAEDETVSEYKIGGEYHGAMSVAFADAINGKADINGDGFVTQRELFAYVQAELFAYVEFKQTPQLLPVDPVADLALFELRD